VEVKDISIYKSVNV